MRLYDFAFPPKFRGRRTLLVAEAEVKREVGENFEELKLIDNK